MGVTPGSAQAAVASTVLAKGIAVHLGMKAADRASVLTLFSNYVHLLPTEALVGISDRSVQSLLMDVQFCFFPCR